MGNLYGSMWRTTVLQHRLIPYTPADPDTAEIMWYSERGYFERGWTTFEDGAAKLAAGHRTAEDKMLLGEKQPKLIDISGAVPARIDVSKAPTLRSLETALSRATFTGKGDEEVVMKLLRDFNTLLMVAAEMRNDVKDMKRSRKRGSGRVVGV